MPRHNRSQKARKSSGVTRKAGRVHSDAMSVEGLHASFEKIDTKMRSLIEKGATNTELSACIRRSWNHHFQHPISESAVKGLLTHYRAIYSSAGSGSGSKRVTRRNRRQKGGMAPLDYQLGQGTSAVPYGIFPSEMGRVAITALDNERFFESPVGRHCNTTGGEAAPGFGAQKGGGLLDSVLNGHAMGSVPRNILETGVSVAQGAPIMNPNPDPVHHTWSAAQTPFTPYDTTQVGQYSALAPVYTGYGK
jgi:hypothetical protein